MGTFGTGPFGSDGALDLLDELVDQPAVQRREALERVFSRLRDRPDLLGRKIFPDEIVAAAAVAAASLPGGEGIRKDLAGLGYDPDRLLVPVPDPDLNHSALEALLVAAGRDGPWHDGWTGPQTAAEARLGVRHPSTARAHQNESARAGKAQGADRRGCWPGGTELQHAVDG